MGTRGLRFSLIPLVLMLLTATGCVQAAPAVAIQGRPTSNLGVKSVETPDPTETPDPRILPEVLSEGTMIARATASPFPTARPFVIRSGVPMGGVARRGGLSLEVHLAQDSYLAGEGGQAQVILRNETGEMLSVDENFIPMLSGGRSLFRSILLDDHGDEPEIWPWSPMFVGSGPARYRQLAAGGVLWKSVFFQIPPVEHHASESYTLSVETRAGRPRPDNPYMRDSIPLDLYAGPIPLKVKTPAASQHLTAELKADHNGYHLRVLDVNAHRPTGQMWGMVEAHSEHRSWINPLGDNPEARWDVDWSDTFGEESQITIRGWVASVGYVVVPVTHTVQ